MARKGQWKEMGTLIDDDVLRAFTLVTSTEDLPEALGQWVGGLADRTGFFSASDVEPDRTVEMIAALRAAASRRGEARASTNERSDNERSDG